VRDEAALARTVQLTVRAPPPCGRLLSATVLTPSTTQLSSCGAPLFRGTNGSTAGQISNLTPSLPGVLKGAMEAPAAAPAPAAAVSRNAGGRVQRVLSFLRRHPFVCLVPLLVLAFCLVAGILGVLTIASSIANQQRNNALNLAITRGLIISNTVQTATIPTQGLRNYILQTPGYWWPSIEQAGRDRDSSGNGCMRACMHAGGTHAHATHVSPSPEGAGSGRMHAWRAPWQADCAWAGFP
jgi:hypothetical protein